MYWTSGEWIGYNIKDGGSGASGWIALTVLLVAGIGYLLLLHGSHKTISRLKDEDEDDDAGGETDGDKDKK